MLLPFLRERARPVPLSTLVVFRHRGRRSRPLRTHAVLAVRGALLLLVCNRTAENQKMKAEVSNNAQMYERIDAVRCPGALCCCSSADPTAEVNMKSKEVSSLVSKSLDGNTNT